MATYQSCSYFSKSFSPISFFIQYNCWICSEPSCHWASHRRFIKSGCQRSKGQTRCCNPLFDPVITPLSCLPALLNSFHLIFQHPFRSFPPFKSPYPSLRNNRFWTLLYKLLINTLHLDNDIHHLENDYVDAIFEDIVTTSIYTTSHIPRNV